MCVCMDYPPRQFTEHGSVFLCMNVEGVPVHISNCSTNRRVEYGFIGGQISF